jgi:hypothetical protein
MVIIAYPSVALLAMSPCKKGSNFVGRPDRKAAIGNAERFGAVRETIRRTALIFGVLLGSAALWPNHCAAHGALAVALPANGAQHGFSYGRSVNYPAAKAAEAAALDKCRTSTRNPTIQSLCKLIQAFTDQCVAVAMDPKDGTPGVGWMIAPDKPTAEAQAMAKCKATAGPGRRNACQTDRETLCDGMAGAPKGTN